MKLSVVICDDMKEHCAQNARLLQDYGQRHNISFQIDVLPSGKALLHQMKPGRWQMVFLDILMPELDGIETARRLRTLDKHCALIFVTTSQDHGIMSYEVQASDYLIKPVTQEQMDRTLDRCLQEKREYFRTIVVRSAWDEVEIPLRCIRYIEIKRHIAYIHTTQQVIQTSRGMNALEEEIASPDFLRCHRSFLVNQHYIQRIDKRDFVLDNGGCVPIGSTDAATIRQKFLDWTFLVHLP